MHVLTGQAVSLAQGPELVTPRGCSAGRATTWSRAPGTVGELQAWEARWRVFEEGGPSSSGAPLQLEAGGHGGRHGVLRTAGAEHHLHIDPGTGRTSLELWIGPGAEASLASLRVKHGARSLRIEVPAEATPPDGFGHWLVVGSLDSAPSTPPAERSLHLTWSASPEGTVIDAVRISREGPRQ